MGKVMARIKLENLFDVQAAKERRIAKKAVRRVEIEALVDTGATMLVIPKEVADALGCPVREHRPVTYANGRKGRVPLVEGLRIEVLGRTMNVEALVMPRGTHVLLGQIPLEGLDFVVNPKTRDLMPNPDHPDEPTMEILAAG
jgi:clan AA aspartic protease